MASPREVPRLTSYIRTYGTVSAPWSGQHTQDPEALIRKRKEHNEKLAKLCNIEHVNNFLCANSMYSSTDVQKMLNELTVIAKTIAGSDSSSQIIEGTVIYLIEFFKDCTQIGPKQMSELRRMFGIYPKKSIDEAFDIIKKCIENFNEDIKEHFIRNGFPKLDEGLLIEEFGSKIKVVSQTPLDDSFFLIPIKEHNEPVTAFEKLSFNFKDAPKEKLDDPAILQQSPPITKKYNKDWLETALQHSMRGDSSNLSPGELSLTVCQLLKTSKSNDEIQNELFDLLGFERVQLIMDILKYRDEITYSKVIDTCYKDSVNEKIPTCMTQVVIQSETEKMLSKQLRKDEKRIQREQNKVVDEPGNVLNAQKLKQMRAETLIEAQNKSIFHHAPREVMETSIYPNVYDQFAITKASAAFVSGRRLLLPEHNRINNQVFEEIAIPVAEKVKIPVETTLVEIESLDEIGMSAFQNTEKLNRIQSMVFDTAYHTNENMLVCAPTGAGKTNVAMLTIIREIKNNIKDGIIQENKFKIVYVAPMKALAAEVVQNFSKRLNALEYQGKKYKIKVKELTGDMQLTKQEIRETQMLVTTPEKWDVVTRKSTGDVELTKLVKLLILDEVHLLDSDRGHVLEALVARTLRQVETSQSMIRIVGLSATLPNYIDVASFLRVNPQIGLFFFDDRFRPVPLKTTFIGVKATNPLQQIKDMDEICFKKVLHFVKEKHQVMVFVHARNATVRTATVLKDLAGTYNQLHLFVDNQDSSDFSAANKNIRKSRNKQLQELFQYGFAIHHAGMLRSDRNLVEKYFREGYIKVLVCTSTLAWGVNLPARGVIIKGTEVYNSEKGKFVDLCVLDVLQIFGRAGRPQYDKKGEGIILTSHDRLSHYLSLLTRQHQIESQFEARIPDNLNAEIALGTVTSVEEGVEWLSYTYLHVRMLKNPLAYGLKSGINDNHRKNLIVKAAMQLDHAEMTRFDPNNEFLSITDMGRTASHYYISSETISRFNGKLNGDYLHDSELFKLISQAQEFDQLKVRDDEVPELDHLLHECWLPVNLGYENTEGKVNILLQTHLSDIRIEGFSLISDQAYVVQNATRIIRALFEICLRKKWALLASSFLKISKMVEKRLWDWQSPLRQFRDISPNILDKLDKSKLKMEDILEMPSHEIGMMTKCSGRDICVYARYIPNLLVDPQVQPITDSILRVTLNIKPDFTWADKYHEQGPENFWIWIEDPNTDKIHHSEYFIIKRKQVKLDEIQTLTCTIPFPRDNRPVQYLIRVISDRWLGSDRQFVMSFENLILPQHRQPHTDLLNLQPLPKTALKNPQYEELYNFEYFNPIQTQIFHTLYYTDHNVLLGAPTGSGKTIAAEIAMFRVFSKYPNNKVVYIAPLKALVRERIEDWKLRFHHKLGKNVVELTGDITPDAAAIANAAIIVTTPEKWDGVSRSWQTRNYVKAVSLIVIDEIHLLGEERGPVLEVIVSRTGFISAHTERKLRVIGLSTALANATDIGNWLGIKEVGLYNFRSSVRPVQLEIHVSGYHGKHYCPRMALMNKPTFQAIKTYSPEKPALVFVSSRRQTRLTAIDLTTYIVAEDNPHKWVHMSDQEMQSVISLVKDQNLKSVLAFGIGIHHAGLHERDRKLVEELFLHQKIQVLIATATLAWGINLPAHLVVIKGTEYFNGKVQRYVDFPITDVMQMAGRAGRPQFDTTGVAVVLVQDSKKDFYKRFLHEPFPVESSLIGALPEHLNAEIVAGTISSKQQCLDYLTWTYFFRRLIQNPVFYGLESAEGQAINGFLSSLIDRCLHLLSAAGCVTVDDDERSVEATVMGKITSYYYLNHRTVLLFSSKLTKKIYLEEMLQLLCDVHEYEELPVRHNEDVLNEELSKRCPIPVESFSYDSPHTKANLLFQAHFSRLSLPCTDYYTDLKSVLDQAIRIIQAMIDVCSDKGFLGPALNSMVLLQMVLQGRWHNDNALLTLPHIEEAHLRNIRLAEKGFETSWKPVECLPLLMHKVTNNKELLSACLRNDLDEVQINEIYTTLLSLPIISMKASIKGWWNESSCQEEKPLMLKCYRGPVRESYWMKVHADQEYVLSVDLKRFSKLRQERKAIAPKFPKQKEEGWFLVLGSKETGELVAMKRVPYIHRRATQQIMFYTPKEIGKVKYQLFLMSDSYLGLDQEYDVYLNVIESSIRAQINTEVDDSSSDEESDEE